MNTERMEETVRLSGFVLPEELEDKLERGVITPLQVEQIIREVSEKIDRVHDNVVYRTKETTQYINDLSEYIKIIRKHTRNDTQSRNRKRKHTFIKMIKTKSSQPYSRIATKIIDIIESEKMTKQNCEKLFDDMTNTYDLCKWWGFNSLKEKIMTSQSNEEKKEWFSEITSGLLKSIEFIMDDTLYQMPRLLSELIKYGYLTLQDLFILEDLLFNIYIYNRLSIMDKYRVWKMWEKINELIQIL